MITKNDTFGTINKIDLLKPYMKYLIYVNGQEYNDLPQDISLEKMLEDAGGSWDTDAVVMGLNFLLEQAEKSQIEYDIWTKDEIEAEPERSRAKMLYFRGKKDKPFIVLCSGGGYMSVCNMAEAFPCAKYLNNLGYHVFVLCYRTAQNGLLPKPIEDLAACIRNILNHAEEFQIDMNHYAVGGFSAGGHLTASWGTDNEGYAKYGLPKPAVLILGYALLSMRELYEDQTADIIRHVMCGENYTDNDLKRVDIIENMSENYPPVYIWQTKTDETILYKNFEWMTEKLQQLSVPFKAKSVEHGPHGMGCGLHSEAEGWLEEAVDFWKQQM